MIQDLRNHITNQESTERLQGVTWAAILKKKRKKEKISPSQNVKSQQGKGTLSKRQKEKKNTQSAESMRLASNSEDGTLFSIHQQQ